MIFHSYVYKRLPEGRSQLFMVKATILVVRLLYWRLDQYFRLFTRHFWWRKCRHFWWLQHVYWLYCIYIPGVFLICIYTYCILSSGYEGAINGAFGVFMFQFFPIQWGAVNGVPNRVSQPSKINFRYCKVPEGIYHIYLVL